ncbi:hypothetical protein HELRODRAFT_177370 [Helobdella robusta]|uniref:C-type lectin domain-containing protein n=1 Tax=Helobdella robusta TaxID=6412 RepID=T1FBK8_HELRO|nr:hypothetical protein HELRODRAFT_177370 [Helobdella robusta]ESN98130.1 hypothetical protein HELRODRAFT_177370 [Helobdella robusta]
MITFPAVIVCLVDFDIYNLKPALEPRLQRNYFTQLTLNKIFSKNLKWLCNGRYCLYSDGNPASYSSVDEMRGVCSGWNIGASIQNEALLPQVSYLVYNQAPQSTFYYYVESSNAQSNNAICQNVASLDCEKNRSLRYKNICYWAIKRGNLTWYEANNECIKLNSTLAVFDGAEFNSSNNLGLWLVNTGLDCREATKTTMTMMSTNVPNTASVTKSSFKFDSTVASTDGVKRNSSVRPQNKAVAIGVGVGLSLFVVLVLVATAAVVVYLWKNKIGWLVQCFG